MRGIRARAVAVAMGCLVARSAAGAQGIDAQCRAGTAAERASQDACQKSVDLYNYLAPQLGAAIVGGNAVAGEHRTLGGLGRVSIGLRATAIRARFPDLDSPLPVTTGAVASTYVVNEQAIPVPTLDAAIGLFRGFLVSGTYALGVDALVNVSYIPEINTDGLAVVLPDGSLKLGFGARVSVVDESVVTPGIVITYIQRDLPRMSITAEPTGDLIRLQDLDVGTSGWRAVIGKSLAVVNLSLGFGQDDYRMSTAASVQGSRAGQAFSAGPILLTQKLKRDNVFGGIAVALPVVRVVAEVGRVSGGRLSTYNQFAASRADDALTYASVGLRFRW